MSTLTVRIACAFASIAAVKAPTVPSVVLVRGMTRRSGSPSDHGRLPPRSRSSAVTRQAGANGVKYLRCKSFEQALERDG